jgi:hypothetical protein
MSDCDTGCIDCDTVCIDHTMDNESSTLSDNGSNEDRDDDDNGSCKQIFEDNMFKDIFVNTDYTCMGFQELDIANAEYESSSGISLRFGQSDRSSRRVYKCVSHESYTFQVSFGSRQWDSKIILKKYNLAHFVKRRPDVAPGGRKWKSRKKNLLKPVIHHLEQNTVNQVSAADVMKSSAAQKNEVISYMQAYRAIPPSNKGKRQAGRPRVRRI